MSLWRRAATVGSWTLASRVLGLLRDHLAGRFFGASLELSAFTLAFQLPNLLRNLFGEGALSSVFIPRYVRARQGDPAAADRFAGLVLARLLRFLSAVALVGMIAAAVVALTGDRKSSLVSLLALPQIPYLVLICTAAIAAGVLNARDRFMVGAASPLILNVVLILALLAWRDVWAQAWAVLVAGVLQLLWHAVSLQRHGGLPPLSLRGDEAYRDLRRALLPGILAAGVFQLSALLESIVAYTCLPERPGAVTILYFANRLLQFPMALVGTAIATAAFPELSAAASAGWTATGEVLRRASRPTLALLVPAAIGLAVVADPLVRAIYQYGAFSAADADRVVVCVHFYSLGLVPYVLARLAVRGLHAHLDQRTPLRIGSCMVALNLALDLLFVFGPLAETGLALASAIAGWAGCLTYLVLLRRRGAGWAFDLRSALTALIGSLPMAAAAWGAMTLAPAWSGSLGRAGAGIVAGGLVYGAWMLAMRRRIN